MKAKLECTRDYEMFEMHECNRPLHENPVLMESMHKNGFMPSSPIQCKRNGNGKLKVVRGHHRLHYAKRLNIPVWYVIDESNCDIFDLEGGAGHNWSVNDFAVARSKAGDDDCAKLLAFRKKHGLTMGAAASLVGGESAGSSNKVKDIKSGSFHAGDMKHAHQVVALTDQCRECGVEFATSSAFVSAVSLALRVPEFKTNVFAHRVKLYSANLRKRGTVDEYLEEIEALYNYTAKVRRIPLAFRAREVARNRHDSFGRNQ